ncbi:hypothetical protein GCM10009665_36590 [Kitasatospora nipponensis]|uniref:Uncharacterized protein n=1 Tax=Kitasatospora nipponensis TaxID=258049 RepID=A0ABN1WA41_9ACTN
MSYGAPVGGFPSPQPAPARPRAAALPGLAVLLLLNLLIELSMLAFDLNREGADYLPTALGFTYDHVVAAPVGFFSGSAATCGALLVLIIGAFSGGGWVRGGGTVLLLTNAYVSASVVIAQLSGDAESRHAFSSPATPNLWLNVGQLTEVLIAIVFALVVLSTRRPAGTGAPVGYAPPQGGGYLPQQGGYLPQGDYPPPNDYAAQGGYLPAPTGQPQPGYAPQVQQPPFPPAPPAQPAQPPAPNYGYPPRPQDAPPTG